MRPLIVELLVYNRNTGETKHFVDSIGTAWKVAQVARQLGHETQWMHSKDQWMFCLEHALPEHLGDILKKLMNGSILQKDDESHYTIVDSTEQAAISRTDAESLLPMLKPCGPEHDNRYCIDRHEVYEV